MGLLVLHNLIILSTDSLFRDRDNKHIMSSYEYYLENSCRGLLDELEDYLEVIEYLSTYLRDHSTNDHAYNNRGIAHWEIGNTQAAEADYIRAIKINDNNLSAWLNLHELYEKEN